MQNSTFQQNQNNNLYNSCQNFDKNNNILNKPNTVKENNNKNQFKKYHKIIIIKYIKELSHRKNLKMKN